jgi:ATP-dependent 26S proteasome regulatory subunit
MWLMVSPLRETRIISLTTNKIEELDEALIRAGRISQKVPFYLAALAIGYEMFLRFM